MKTTLFFILTSLFSINSSAQQDSTIFKGRIENKEFQVYIVMDFYKNNIIVPRQQILEKQVVTLAIQRMIANG